MWQAFEHVAFKLERLVREWSPERVGGSDALSNVLGMVSAIADLGRKKFEFLDTIPYLFCRLKEPGVKDRILRQWEEAPPGQHDKVSQFMLGDKTPFKPMVLRVRPDGSNLSKIL